MKKRAFTILELVIVVGIVAILISLLFPALKAHFEGARINEAKAQLLVLKAALAQYQREFGDYPPSSGYGNSSDNAGNEIMLACLRPRLRIRPFTKEIKEKEGIIARWLGDTDGDGWPEFLDPWKNPWIYFHPSDYSRGAVYYTRKGKRITVEPARKGDVYQNLNSYQLWCCGPNLTDESDKSGLGDDIGNLMR